MVAEQCETPELESIVRVCVPEEASPEGKKYPTIMIYFYLISVTISHPTPNPNNKKNKFLLYFIKSVTPKKSSVL